jgi:hypothetical protein
LTQFRWMAAESIASLLDRASAIAADSSSAMLVLRCQRRGPRAADELVTFFEKPLLLLARRGRIDEEAINASTDPRAWLVHRGRC